MNALLLSLLTFFSTTIGGWIGLRNSKRLHYVMSFTAGVLLGVVFFDILPEALEVIYESGFSTTPLMVAIVVGFIAFHLLEKTVLIHHSHEEDYADHSHPDVGLVGAAGLSFHSFLDGVGIGLGFQVSPQMGIMIAIAVIAHDFSDGLNTVAFMLTHKNTSKRTLIMLLTDALAPILGAASTLLFTIPNSLLVRYLGFFAGFLLYIGTSDLLPEAHRKHSSYAMLLLTILGAAFVFVMAQFT